MRSAAALLAAAALAVAALPSFAEDPVPSAGDPPGHEGHGHAAEMSLSELTAEQRAAAVDAWAHVFCNCPRENWSKTLANCPDGCAIPQKQEILHRIVDGWDLDQIVAEQVKKYGPKAAANPGTFVNGTLLVLAGLVLGAGISGGVLAAWRKSAAERRAAAEAERAARPVGAAETDAVERELREID